MLLTCPVEYFKKRIFLFKKKQFTSDTHFHFTNSCSVPLIAELPLTWSFYIHRCVISSNICHLSDIWHTNGYIAFLHAVNSDFVFLCFNICTLLIKQPLVTLVMATKMLQGPMYRYHSPGDGNTNRSSSFYGRELVLFALSGIPDLFLSLIGNWKLMRL